MNAEQEKRLKEIFGEIPRESIEIDESKITYPYFELSELTDWDYAGMDDDAELEEIDVGISPSAIIEAYEKKRGRNKAIRRIGLAVAAAIVLFFAATPTGQSLAKGIINTIVTVFDDAIRIDTRGIESAPAQINPVEPREFDDISEAAEYISRQLVYVDGTDAELQTVNIDYFDGLYKIISEYTLPDERTFDVFQTIFEDSDNAVTKVDYAKNHDPIQLFNGQTMYCMTHSDDTYSGTASWDNITLSISSETIGWDELTKYVDNFTYY